MSALFILAASVHLYCVCLSLLLLSLLFLSFFCSSLLLRSIMSASVHPYCFFPWFLYLPIITSLVYQLFCLCLSLLLLSNFCPSLLLLSIITVFVYHCCFYHYCFYPSSVHHYCFCPSLLLLAIISSSVHHPFFRSAFLNSVPPISGHLPQIPQFNLSLFLSIVFVSVPFVCFCSSSSAKLLYFFSLILSITYASANQPLRAVSSCFCSPSLLQFTFS